MKFSRQSTAGAQGNGAGAPPRGSSTLASQIHLHTQDKQPEYTK